MQKAKQLVGQEVQLDGKIYSIAKANNGEESCLSLKNVSSGFYLRHKDGRLVETDENDNAAFFAADSSFVPEDRGDGFVLRCSNEGMDESYICKLDIDTYIVSEDLVEFVFFPVEFSKQDLSSIVNSEVDVDEQRNEQLYGRKIVLNNIVYIVVPANDGKNTHVSLLNIVNGLYARHYKGKIVESTSESGELFLADSSFYSEIDKENVVLCCVNKGMENLAIAYNEKDDVFVIGEKNNGFAFPLYGSESPWEALKDIISNIGHIYALLLDKTKTN